MGADRLTLTVLRQVRQGRARPVGVRRVERRFDRVRPLAPFGAREVRRFTASRWRCDAKVRARQGSTPSPRRAITDRRPIPAHRPITDRRPVPRRADQGPPPDPRAPTDHGPPPGPAPGRSGTAAPSPRWADHEPPPDPRRRADHRPPPDPRKRRERGLICGNPLARASFRKISPLHGLISTEPARSAGFREISPPPACRAPEHAASRTAKARKALPTAPNGRQ
jgi:hypothetical protein